jgi:predicted MPP superfamily phosphohydrolase
MIFFSIVSAVLILVQVYIAWRLTSTSRLSGRKKGLIWFAFMLLPLLLPVHFAIRSHGVKSPLGDLVAWVAFTGIGFCALLFAMLLLRDVVWILPRSILKGFSLFSRSDERADSAKDPDPERRGFLLGSANLGIVTGAFLLTGQGFYEARRRPRVTDVAVPFRGLPSGLEGFRIAQISDIHVGPTIKRPFVQGVVETVEGIHADLIVLTGDLPDGAVSVLRDDVAPLRDLSAPYGKLYVTGNHEYYSGVLPWLAEAEKLGFRPLMNEHTLLTRDGGNLLLAGITDYSAGRFLPDQRSDPKKALSGYRGPAVKILLAHQPRSIFAAEGLGYDLQISGHTHGGQFFPWNAVVACFQPYIKGLHRHGSMWIYVSRGTGYWGPPLRLGIPSEITVIRLTKWVEDNAARTGPPA